MKTAEEWIEIWKNSSCFDPTIVWAKQIQLDAMQEGMRRAAEVTRTWAQDDKCIQPSYTKLTKAVLNIANNLTLQDL